jgi:hypothetical protein
LFPAFFVNEAKADSFVLVHGMLDARHARYMFRCEELGGFSFPPLEMTAKFIGSRPPLVQGPSHGIIITY